MRIELEVKDGAIAMAAFTANACAICTASASLLTERIRGLALEQASGVTEDDAIAALDTELPAGRVQCAVLPVRRLRDALDALRSAA